MSNLELSAQIEALLFVSGRPLSPSDLAIYAGSSVSDVEAALLKLAGQLADHGLSLICHKGEYELATHPAAREAIERLQNSEVKSELSKPALETLAIIAYKQPISRSGIEEIRGVASEQSIKNLLLRGLVVEAGKSKEPGKPTLYATSHSFLRHFGLTTAAQLPALDNFEVNHHAA